MLRRTTVMIVMMLAAAAFVGARQQTKPDSNAVLKAFEHYEKVRVALSADKLDDVAPHAKELAAAIEPVGGADAKKAADALATAKTIDDARKHFGDLSTAVVPVFQAAAIPGTTAYMCEMKKKPWMQKGDKVENPYYGKAMLTCGSALPASRK